MQRALTLWGACYAKKGVGLEVSLVVGGAAILPSSGVQT